MADVLGEASASPGPYTISKFLTGFKAYAKGYDPIVAREGRMASNFPWWEAVFYNLGWHVIRRLERVELIYDVYLDGMLEPVPMPIIVQGQELEDIKEVYLFQQAVKNG